MLKKNKGLLIATSFVILLPILAGLIFYDRLPDSMNIHWNLQGETDGQGSKHLMIFLMPCILLAVHWLCILVTVKAPKGYGENDKMFRLMLWFMPILSLLVNGMMYLSSAGHGENAFMLMPVLLGALFIVIGNYMPKTKQNWTMGIKIKWTLSSEENWYATHRLAGKLWVLGGALMILAVLLPGSAMMIALGVILAVMVMVPFVYSWRYYQKQLREGKKIETVKLPFSKGAKIASAVALGAVLILICVLMFTGSMEIEYDQQSFTLRATYWQPITVAYDQIESMEYRENWQAGSKVSGFDSARLLLGSFKNSEVGNYTSYCYRAPEGCVLLTVNGRYLALSGKDEAATRVIYNTLLAKMGE